MGTRALDLVTIGIALVKLEKKISVSGKWLTKMKPSSEIEYVLEWFDKNRKLLTKVKNLDVKISFDAGELNKILEEENFHGSIKGLNSGGMGFVAILDKTVKWLNGVADECKIHTKVGEKPGFELNDDEVNIYAVDGYKNSILVKPLTNQQNNIWFFLHDNPSIQGLEMSKLAIDVMRRKRHFHSKYEVAKIPKIDFEEKPNIKWMKELMFYPDTKNINDAFFLNEAEQIFKMRMDETGARVKVVTYGSGVIGCAMRMRKEVLIIDKPFYGWWTQNDLEELPMACFYADYDSWKEPEGSLGEL